MGKRLLLRNREGKLLSFWSNRGLRNRDVNRLFYWSNRDLRNRDVNNNFSWSSKDLKRKREDKQLFLPNSKLNNSQASQALLLVCLEQERNTMSSLRFLESSRKNTTLENRLDKQIDRPVANQTNTNQKAIEPGLPRTSSLVIM